MNVQILLACRDLFVTVAGAQVEAECSGRRCMAVSHAM